MNYLRFIYTKHSRARINEREISVRQVELTVRSPDNVRASFGDRCIAQKHFRNKIAEVVYTNVRGRIVIITAYWLEEFKK